jgi:peroxiredoxin
MSRLQNDQQFPSLEIPKVGGGILSLPTDLAGGFGVVLIYRGEFCPFCREQIAAFQGSAKELAAEGIKIAALSVDDEAVATDFVAKHHVSFPVGYGADVDRVADLTGAYTNKHDGRRILESTGFVLTPNGGNVLAAVYSSRALGRLTPNETLRIARHLKEGSSGNEWVKVDRFPYS